MVAGMLLERSPRCCADSPPSYSKDQITHVMELQLRVGVGMGQALCFGYQVAQDRHSDGVPSAFIFG
jgi:hypothetical protein